MLVLRVSMDVLSAEQANHKNRLIIVSDTEDTKS